MKGSPVEDKQTCRRSWAPFLYRKKRAVYFWLVGLPSAHQDCSEGIPPGLQIILEPSLDDMKEKKEQAKSVDVL